MPEGEFTGIKVLDKKESYKIDVYKRQEKRSPARAILSISRFPLERRARTIPGAAKKKEVPQQRKRMEMTPRISEAIDS